MEIFITTSELIEESEKIIGTAGMRDVPINYNKLLRWQQKGLLPRQRLCGAGPGERQESLWGKSCIGRLQVIAGCVKGKRLNCKAAEQALIATGFWIRGDLLKKHLLAACKKMSADLEKQQRVDSPDPTDRAANLERSTRDRMSAHGEFVKAIFAICRLGYTDLNEEEEHFKSLAALASFFRPKVLRDLIENSQPEQLEIAYQSPAVISFAALIASLFDLICGQSKELPITGLADNAIINSLLNMLMPKPSGKLRRKKPYPYSKEMVQYNAHLTAIIFYLVYCEYKDLLLPLIPLLVAEALNKQELVVPENIKDMLNSKLEEPNALFNLPSMSK
ncbi:hypothetical protein [Nitrosomonas sp. Nm166]|uniref:hypothetical protein n=1 Tax=Nitrosomonas sp. Nm166 TaxID=1881054 RepID=UPI001160AF8A|nr:hypothetical protein [Nitrosomonas sp. Nm166]